ncbi:glycosyltransferase [Motilimonas sp. E26]|uniref:glycosyltransferase n=1 Tax=Motilimonas sp. E26 TaxID=2865674 RepID=UPI001E4AF808|nr:glycosyltransferase [Motilimonas sp. E26]MCE0555608.1 glycosyltransferase [Motilimonas sp. E26]
MKKKLYIICPNQFGYLIDTYQYAKNLKNDYDVVYISFYYGMEAISESGVDVIEYKCNDKGFKRWFGFARFCASVVKDKNATVFVKYFRLCSLVKLFGGKNDYIMDIRTVAIDNSYLYRLVFNETLKLESLFFKKITVISKSVADFLNISKYSIIPLGCPEFQLEDKAFNSLSLLYVGTLSCRDIHKTVTGLATYLKSSSDGSIVSYDIIGDGYANEVDELKALVKSLGLEAIVNVHGRIPFNKLNPYYEKANVGISFVPMTEHFDVQPVTKTLEYLAAGMAVIGTRTSAQMKILTDDLGVLVNDSEDDFARGIAKLVDRKGSFNSSHQTMAVKDMSWSSISKKLDSDVLS